MQAKYAVVSISPKNRDNANMERTMPTRMMVERSFNPLTHVMGALYETFSPEEARRLWEKLEIHSTPKHGSWLNMAEIELAVLNRQCLARRIPSKEFLVQETQAWVKEHNARGVVADWRFTTEDARIKLKHLYPSIDR